MNIAIRRASKLVLASSLLFASIARGQTPLEDERRRDKAPPAQSNSNTISAHLPTAADPRSEYAPTNPARRSSLPNSPDATSPDFYRVVTNHASIPSRSPFWKTLTAKCLSAQTNSAVMQEITVKRIYGVDPAASADSPYYGAGAAKHLISEEHVAGRRFILQNHPATLTPGSPEERTFIAMPIGTTNTGTELLEIWDCGVPYEKWLAQQPHSTPTPSNSAAR